MAAPAELAAMVRDATLRAAPHHEDQSKDESHALLVRDFIVAAAPELNETNAMAERVGRPHL